MAKTERQNTELFIARRLTGKGAGKPNIMVRIAVVTVAISTAVMIISIAVISGFRSEISGKISGFGGHVQIVNLDGNTSLETQPILRNEIIEEEVPRVPGFRSINAYAVKGGIIKTDEAIQGVMLKGVDGAYDWGFFRSYMVEGELPSVGDSVRTKDILLSRRLSSILKVGVDDRIEMIFVQEGESPRRDRFKISGIYETGFEELDMLVALTDIRNVQRLNGWDYSRITGYEVTGNHFDDLRKFSNDLYRVISETPGAVDSGLLIVDITERYPNIFDWLSAFDVNALVIIIIMLLVAFLNIVSALLIILLERTSMIGVLKALGMPNTSLQKTFIIRCSYLVAKGMIWGNVIGIGLCLLQKYTGWARLDENGYFLSEVPIRLEPVTLLTLNIGTFAILVLLLMIPTRIIAGIKPDRTIRYQ